MLLPLNHACYTSIFVQIAVPLLKSPAQVRVGELPSLHSQCLLLESSKRRRRMDVLSLFYSLFACLFCVEHKEFLVLLRCVLLHWGRSFCQLRGRKQEGDHWGKFISKPFLTNEFWQIKVTREGALREPFINVLNEEAVMHSYCLWSLCLVVCLCVCGYRLLITLNVAFEVTAPP